MSTMMDCIGECIVDGKYVALNSNFFGDYQSYAMYGWLAGVRNYSGIVPLDDPRGLPDNVSPGADAHFFGDDDRLYYCEPTYHSVTWHSLDVLLDYDYSMIVENRRVTIDNNGGCTCPVGEGVKMTLREFLGDGYFNELYRARDLGVVRFIMGFC